ncbi:efflux RND transporter permease subunit [Shewanella schlegeliana]|uniref:Efflux RND transporter permease subunit n=1 Tax=Shewanella schlegeliana TaxID=190308 RepID=A0ABS1T2L3_9GAMM|nr:efflux RND transporter permease subunit [Shewanella schlegeliana]MBL4914057.1 efflux RND transporter permease subunit [Shewanella schlegeliana]MCL1110904.1 efflux RND transporter permease subunit [Shewanella schlegeliana]GIU34805.1 acriflavin resistance protein [Shewanella schlegeliana]
MVKSLVENGRLISLVIALLVVAGFGAISSLPRMEDPEITNRFSSVITYYPGASAERVEALVTEVLESELRRLEELKLVQSTSRPGISVIQLELKDDVTDTAPVWSRARDLIADTKGLLPLPAQNSTLDDQLGYANTAILAVAWRGSGVVRTDMLNRYAKELQSRLRLLSGTDFVNLYGQPAEEILVQLDGNKVNQLGLSAQTIAQILQNADAKVSAGEINNDNFRALVEVSGELDSIARISQVPLIVTADGQMIRLADIAAISRQPKEPANSIALIDQQQGVMVAARMLSNTRVDLWLEQVRYAVDELQTSVPANIEIQWLFDQKGYTTQRLSDLIGSLLLGFVIILAVLMLTLGLRNAVIVSLSLPLTALFTLACMKYIGLPIHQMSVTGLVVALGIMVDNAIVIVDAISQRRQQGMDRLNAVKQTLAHLWLPLAGSTITTMLAFAPIVLMPGAAGEFVGGIAISVMFALLGSFIISHTIIAGLAGRFGVDGKGTRWYHHGINLPFLSNAFRETLSLALSRPLIAAIIIGVLPVMGFVAAGKMTEQFFPPSDRDMFQIEVYLAPYASIDNTKLQVDKIDNHLRATSGITRIDWVVGGNVPSFYYNLLQRQQGASNYAQAMVKVKDFATANTLIPQLQQELDRVYPEAQIIVRKLEQGPPFNAPVEVRIFGPNLDQLKLLGEQVRKVLSNTPDVIHTRATLSAGAPKVWLQINEDASLMSGLSLTDIAKQVEMATTGINGGSVLEQTESLPVRVRLSDSTREEQTKLSAITLISNQGKGIPLSAISTSEIEVSRGAIPRRDGQRVNIIEAYLTSGVLPQTVVDSANEALAGIQLPSGYRIELGGESAKRNEAVGNLMSNLVLVVTLLLATVVLSFNSFRLTGIILFSAMQSAGLGLLAVYSFGYPFGFTVIIGLLGLMGLAINAAIVILAELEEAPETRAGDIQKIVDLVTSCGRHIGSTTITTIGGFLPLIIAGGGFWPPFAIAIAGGTLLTTLLSLIWVPTMYHLIMGSKKANQTASNGTLTVDTVGL